MEILFLTPRLPYPPHRGDKLKIYHLLRILSRNHKITLISFVESRKEAKLVANLAGFCDRIETVIHPPLKSYVNVTFNLLGVEPFQVAYFNSKLFTEKLKHILNQNKIDIIHTHLIRMAQYTTNIPDVPCVLDLTDAISLSLERRLQITQNTFKKVAVYTEMQRMLRYETILETFERVLVCSDIDRQALLKSAPNAYLDIIHNGLDVDYFQLRQAEPESFTILYTGNMSYLPNEDGILFFYNHIFAEIRQEIPQVHLYIVGQSPSETVKNLAKDSGVTVTGFVPDIRDYYKRAHVVICPIRFGAGTLNKVIEAMAMGVPVVSTSIACAGMNVTDGENIIFADRPKEFAQAIIHLMRNPDICRRIGEAGRQLVELEHDWEKIVTKLEGIYQNVVELRNNANPQ